jgi:4-hydroxy-tetrahydrodipicolinate synthase
MNNGFYTALGTPFDEQGNFLEGSFRKQVKDQIAAGASGLLALGSMGYQPGVLSEDCPKVARACVEEAKGACPVLVGVMDNSCARVLARIEDLRGIPIDGVVATTPFFIFSRQEDLIAFFQRIADRSAIPLYLYDLPVITKVPIEIPTAEALMTHKNIVGIKSGILHTARNLLHSPANDGSFEILFSDLDLVDVAYNWGLRKCLDGMFSMMPKTAKKFGDALRSGDMETARTEQDTISRVRTRLRDVGIFRAYSEGMNLLGYEGRFSTDFMTPLNDEEKELVASVLRGIER